MTALASAWLGLAAAALAVAMVVYRPAMTDLAIVLVLGLGSPGAACLAALGLWTQRRDDASDPGVAARRLQCMAGMALSLFAAAVVYLLVADSAPGGVIEP